tara:strand:+ start:588 stop:767 length:180 start_codon:yes stop_codon:yes gene_type:complete
MEMPFWKHYILDIKRAFSRNTISGKAKEAHPSPSNFEKVNEGSCAYTKDIQKTFKLHKS